MAAVSTTSEFLAWSISIIQTKHKETAGELDLETNAISTQLRVRNGATVRLDGTTVTGDVGLEEDTYQMHSLRASSRRHSHEFVLTCRLTLLELGRQHLEESSV